MEDETVYTEEQIEDMLDMYIEWQVEMDRRK